MKTPQQVLEEAAEYISEHGWIQGTWANYDGTVCAMGGINAVCGVGQTGFVDFKLVEAAEGLLIEEIGTSLISAWNDDPERTKEDVILTMKRAANR